MKKTLVLLDTNKARDCLRGAPRYDEFEFGSEFKELMKIIDVIGAHKYVDIAVTDMTLRELETQKKKTYEKDVENLNDASARLRTLDEVDIPNYTLPEDSFDLSSAITPKMEKFLEEKGIIVMKIKEEEKSQIMDEAIAGAIAIAPPFRSGKNNSDIGFKDFIIWRTLNRWEKISEYERVILFTSDTDFSKCKLDKQEIELKILGSSALIEQELKDKYEQKLLDEEYRELFCGYLKEDILKLISAKFDVEDIAKIQVIRDSIVSVSQEESELIISKLEEYSELSPSLVRMETKINEVAHQLYILVDKKGNTILDIIGEDEYGA